MSTSDRPRHVCRLLLLPGLVSALPAPAEPRCAMGAEQPASVIETRDVLEAVRRCAHHGDAQAQLRLARMYQLGEGVEQDELEAAFWYREAARRAVPEAQFQLGLMYLQGVGVSENTDQALRWISRAAAQDHTQAQALYDYILYHDEPLDC